MFDWNDEELTNIIWGEAGENDDHIVPYPDQIEEKHPVLYGDTLKKESSQQTSSIINPLEQKTHTGKPDHGTELDSNFNNVIGDPASCPDDPDASTSRTARADQNSTRTDASNVETTNSQKGSVQDEMAQLDKNSGIFEDPPEDGEQGDFVDYDWANIGSFDDLDRIFSNNDPMFGDISVGNADELWPPSKDMTSSPLESNPLSGDSSDLAFDSLRTSVEQSEMKAHQYMLDPDQQFIYGFENRNETTSRVSQDVQASIDSIENFGGKRLPIIKEKSYVMGKKIQTCSEQINDGTATSLNVLRDKGNRQNKLTRAQKPSKKTRAKQLHDLTIPWASSGKPFQQINSRYTPPIINQTPTLVVTQQIPLQTPGPFLNSHFPAPPLGSPLYSGNMRIQYSSAPVSAQFHPLERKSHEQANANSAKNSKGGASIGLSPTMTPKEKIEKLRKRQQMRAILAIQKQQMQFGNQAASVSGHLGVDGGTAEGDETLSSFPSLEQQSPLDHYNSDTMGALSDNYSVEEPVLYRLQNTISKMDMRIRLCIRDSLYRLARSAMWRQYPNEMSRDSTSSRDEVQSNKVIEDHERFARISDVETDTNPIDRTVAHLLFHRPVEFSGKPAEAPESPLSADLPDMKDANPIKSLAKGYFPKSSDNNTQMMSPHETKPHSIFPEDDQSKNCLCFATSENTVNNENTDEC